MVRDGREERLYVQQDAVLEGSQYVWSQRYIDAMVLRDRDVNYDDGDGREERLYVQQDASFNVTGRFKTGHCGARSKPASLVMLVVPHLDDLVQHVAALRPRRSRRGGYGGSLFSTRRDCLNGFGVFRRGEPITVGGIPPALRQAQGRLF